MDQDNATRLKENFRFAAVGARCRTATFINPAMAETGVVEWMEAECPTGKDWNIKLMKFHPAQTAEDEGTIEQIYLQAHRNMTFGEIVMKLTEYQAGQAALGFLTDPEDKAQMTGAVFFHDMAKEQGIAFNIQGEPVAPLNGVLTVPGRYPARTFMQAHQVATAKRLSADRSPAVGVSDKTKLELLIDKLDEISGYVAWSGTLMSLSPTREAASIGIAPYKPLYSVFIKSYDEKMKLVSCFGFTPAMQDRVDRQLDLYNYHSCRMAAAWINHQVENKVRRANHPKTKIALEEAVRRLHSAWEKLHPGVEINLAEELDFSKAHILGKCDADILGKKNRQICDRQPLDNIIEELKQWHAEPEKLLISSAQEIPPLTATTRELVENSEESRQSALRVQRLEPF